MSVVGAGARRIARIRRRRRVRRKVVGTDQRPRLSVFRSNRHLYVQVISDESGRTLAAGSTLNGEGAGPTKEKAVQLGKEIAPRGGGTQGTGGSHQPCGQGRQGRPEVRLQCDGRGR